MTTYTKETALYDTGAIAGDIQEAGAQVSKYITAIGDEGIKVHPYDATQGQADTDNYAKIDSDGIEIWQKPTGASASVKVAEFGADGVQIGQIGESHLEMDYHSMRLVDLNGNTYFYVSDLRGDDGKAHIVDKFSGGEQRYWLTFAPTSSNYTVTGTNWGGRHVVYKGTEYFDFNDSLPYNATVIVEYDTESEDVKAYTIGMRGTGDVGASSSVVGTRCVASGVFAHAEGLDTTAEGYCAHAEGQSTTANLNAHAEGYITTASGHGSHAEGEHTTASGGNSHAEGVYTIASGGNSHAEGESTTASGLYSHSEGINTSASGYASHAEGRDTTASEYYSHAAGWGTIAVGVGQTAIGKYNIQDPDVRTSKEKAFIIGNGSSLERSNALTVDWMGRVECGNYSGTFKNIFDIFYPKGSYYETSLPSAIPSGRSTPNATDLENLGTTWFNPNYAFGGTWVLEVAGQVHVSSGTGYSVSGALTNESDGGSRYIQAHTHAFTQPTITSYYAATVSYGSGSASRGITQASSTGSTTNWAKASGGAVGAVSGVTTGSGGNMPPYIVVNRWHRTA